MFGQLPPELVHVIISEFWYSEHPSQDRIIFMKACPLVNSLWKGIFTHITSRDIFVPTKGYLLYLSSIIHKNDSLIYHLHLPHSTRTITCHVNLVDATRDAAQEPYTILSNLPNYIGFRKCFPNITQIFLEIRCRDRRGCFLLIMPRQHHTIRTRISIALDQATAQLSVLPLDWEIVVENPEPDYIYGEHAHSSWIMFLEDASRYMAPAALFECLKATPFEDMLSHSTYLNCIRRFSGHGVHAETEGDVRGMNRRFGKAVRVPRPFGLWAFFVESYEYVTWMDDTVWQGSNWHGIASSPPA